MRFDVVPVRQDHLRYTWDHRREHCRLEETEEITRHFHELEGWCARLDGEAIAVWGTVELPSCVLAWGWQTDRVYREWRKLTRVARAYYRVVARQNEKPLVLFARDTPEQARWLEFIGFRPTGRYELGSHKYEWIGGDNREWQNQHKHG